MTTAVTASGYISDVPENIYVTGKGLAPKFWWGTTPPDGDAAPWSSAPMGSQYTYKSGETGTVVLFLKVDNNENDNDWGSISIGRTITGGPVGLLLALTKN